ncbi:MAG: PIN domain-containing protein [Gemmatimonadaceae bacterium]
MIVADTGAIVAVIDADDKHHDTMVELFEEDPGAWVLPWAILPEVDYLLSRYLGAEAAQAFLGDVASGAFTVEFGSDADLKRAHELCERYASLELGMVDAVVVATAERLRAEASATFDLRDFGAIALRKGTRLLPRDR